MNEKETDLLETKNSKIYGSVQSSQTSSVFYRKSVPDFRLFTGLAQRLRYHKELFGYRRLFAILSLAFALLGLIMAVILIEINIHNISSKNKMHNGFIIFCIIKWSITITTIILIIMIFVYHHMDLQIEMQRYNIDNWRMAFNCRRFLKISLEFIVCVMHPFPFYSYNSDHYLKNNKSNHNLLEYVDGIMCMMMCLRLYLLARVLILRSTLYHDASAQTYGAINQTSLNTKFIFKSWMNLYSGYILATMIFIIFVWGSWSNRVCEIYTDIGIISFSNSMWFTAVTFLSIGYGDIVPSNACGKVVAAIMAALGAGCTALVVAIFASKLELSQTEKYLHNFVQDSQLNHRLKVVSANILKYAWRQYRYQRAQGPKSNDVLRCKKKVYLNVRLVQSIRVERKHLTDNTLSLLEVNRAQQGSRKTLEVLNEDARIIEERLLKICEKVGIPDPEID